MKDSLEQFLSNVTNPLKQTKENMENVFSTFDKMLPEKPEITSEAKYEDIIAWFLSQPRHPDVKCGAIAKRVFGKDNKIAIIQVFLNGEKQVIQKLEGHQYGRKIITQSLDKELREAFGANNVIIVN